MERGDGGGRKCQIVNECIETLEAQKEALDGARREQGDLYKAMGTADFEHGRGSVESLGEKIDEQAPSFFVWKNKDQAGFPLYLREYKTTVDEIFAMMGAERTAAFNGAYDPKKTGLAGSSAYGLTPQKVSEKLNAAKGEGGTPVRVREVHAGALAVLQRPGRGIQPLLRRGEQALFEGAGRTPAGQGKHGSCQGRQRRVHPLFDPRVGAGAGPEQVGVEVLQGLPLTRD